MSWAGARRTQETGASMLLALLMMLVMLALVSVLTATVIAGTQKSGQTRDLTYHSLAADAAVNDALDVANNQTLANGRTALMNYVGEANAKEGEFTPNNSAGLKVNWRWWVEATPSTVPYSDYQVYAVGYRDDPDSDSAYRVTARLTSIPITGAEKRGDDGIITYLLPPSGIYGLGTVALTDGMIVGNDASFYTYNSVAGTPISPTPSTTRGAVSVAGEGNLIAQDHNGVMGAIHVYNVPEDGNVHDRCGNTLPGEDEETEETTPNSSECHNINATSLVSYSHNINSSWSYDTTKTEFYTGVPDGEDACPEYEDWVASENGGIMSPTTSTSNYMCINDLTIDANTTIASRFSTGSPLYLFVNGDVNVLPGMKFNVETTPIRGPLSLRMFVKGNVNIAGQPAVETQVRALIIAADGNGVGGGRCVIGSPADPVNKAVFRGSLACDVVEVHGDAQVWHDLQTLQTGVGGVAVSRAWSLSNFQIIN